MSLKCLLDAICSMPIGCVASFLLESKFASDVADEIGFESMPTEFFLKSLHFSLFFYFYIKSFECIRNLVEIPDF